MAFGLVVSFIEDSSMTAVDKIHVFKLSDLVKTYHTNLEELGIHLETRIHSKQLKNRLLSQYQDLSVQNF